MFDGRLTRLAILLMLLVSPTALAGNPSSDRPSSDSADGQDIYDMAADPSGQFVGAVVFFDNAKATGGLLPGTSSHDDLYVCDYGSADHPTSGSGCRGLRHNPQTVVAATQTPNAPQRIFATSVDSGGRQGIFAVVGPDRFISLWRTTSDSPQWTVSSQDNYATVNVTGSSDASRIVVGTVSPTQTGRVEARFGNNGTQEWMIALTNAANANVRPTSLDYSREGNSGVFGDGSVRVLAIGTNDDVLFADPSVKPTGSLGGLSQVDAVRDVQLSRDGQYVVVGASNGIFLATLARESGKIVPKEGNSRVFGRDLGDTQDVAISLDGSRFAAAAGNRIHFFRRLDTAAVAEPAGDAYDAGARVSDLAYDAKGQILVAIAGNRVLAFGPAKSTPIWTFDATQSAFGSLDGPLRRISISDDGLRILVAGKTKTMAYSSAIAVTGSLATSSGATSLQPTQTMPLTLTVKNAGSLPDNYTFSVIPPIGWTSTSADGIRLDPEEVGTVRFNVTAPAGQQPGVFATQVRVRSQVTDDVAARRGQPSGYIAGPSVNLTVPRSVVLKVEAPDDRINLRQGAEQTIAITLRNEGNADGVVNLSTRQELTRGATWDIRFQPSEQVIVPASGIANVNVLIRAPSDAGSGDRNIITLRAREGDTVEATDQVTVYVDAQFEVELRSNKTSWEFFPGQTQTILVNVTNTGNTDDTYNLTQVIAPATVQSDWRITIESNQVQVARGETKRVSVTVKAVASDAREATLTIRTISQASPDKKEATLVLNLATVPRPTTPEKSPLPMPGLASVVVLAAIVALVFPRGGRR